MFCLLLLSSPLPLLAQETGEELKARVQTPREVWVLGFEFNKMRMISPRRGPGKGKTYWYLVYTLENKTGEDRDYYLSVTGTSDRGKRYSSLFLPGVEREIERQERARLWGKVDKFKILAKRDPKSDRYNYVTIKSGEKRRCVAVFNEFDANANKITIDVLGLSNDIDAKAQPDGSTMIRQRVRRLHFWRAGDEYEVTKDSIERVNLEWVKVDSKISPAAQ